MCNRAEQAALEAYPPTYTTVKRHAKRVQSERTDTHQTARAIFQHGYEQAEKDTIARAVKWLDKNIYNYEVKPMGEYNRLALLEDLKEAMEKED